MLSIVVGLGPLPFLLVPALELWRGARWQQPITALLVAWVLLLLVTLVRVWYDAGDPRRRR